MRKILFFSVLISIYACSGTDEKQPNGTGEPAKEPSTGNTSVTFSEQPSKGAVSTITGLIEGATPETRVFLDRKTADAHDIISSVKIDDRGNFELKADVESPALYRLRIGQHPVYLALKGKEQMNVRVRLQSDRLIGYEVEGSPLSEELRQWNNPTRSADEIGAYIDQASADKALVKYFLVEKLNIAEHLGRYKKLIAELSGTPYATPLTLKVSQQEALAATPRIEVGAVAPDIRLPNVDGSAEYALSELRGKVVLLDFWASWCGPCRRENPNVVRLYKQFKSKGFEVFSVSLDGLDDRTMLLLNDAARLNQAVDQERARWKDAIAKDGLEWKYHVSDLRKWNSVAAMQYQVGAIPFTLLLDRKGVIRYKNLRGAELENRLKELL